MSATISLPVYECDHCGACCGLLVEADAYDVVREPRINEVYPIRGRSMPLSQATWILGTGGKNKACKFLGERNRCDIYATRPACCVAFQAGQKQCQEVREANGLPPLMPLARKAKTPIEAINSELRSWNDDEEEGGYE